MPDATAIVEPKVTTFFHEPTNTACHVVRDPQSNACAIVDSVLDYDPKAGRTSTDHADRVIAHVENEGLSVEWLLETHAHADHLSAAPYLEEKLGGRIAIGEHIRTVQDAFKTVFNAEPGFATDGSQFDHLFTEGDTFAIGALEGRVIHTPGHTPACVSYVIGDAAFVGDTLFMPDYGTARCDFPGGDAATLYESIQKLFALPGETRIFLCHDYKTEGRDEYVWETTVAAERDGNKHVGGGADKDEFVKWRRERDATLEMPTLILPSIQINMRAGRFPPPEDNGVSYIKIPLDVL